MAEVYVTLSEAAELEGVQYQTMARRTQRNKKNFVTKTEKSETGGRDVVLVAVSSLSKQARNAWKEREKLKSFTEEFPDKKEDEQKPEVPWYVNTDVDWYIENYKERYYKAVELGNVVRKFLQYDEGDRTKYAEEFAQKYLGKGQRTLYRYTKAYLEASAWADKLEKEDGAGREFFKVLCLCRKPKETGCFPSIKPEVKQVIKNIWFNEDFARNQGTREMLYEKLTAIANINKWEKIPSYQTVTRYISYLMEDEGMRNAWFLASRGTREYKNKVMVKGSRDTKGLQVMQIVMGDEHHRMALPMQVLQHSQHLAAGVAVQRAGGLIRQQDIRVVDQRTGNGNALHLAAGHFAGVLVQLIAQPHLLQRLGGAALALCARDAGNGQGQLHVGQNGLMGDQVVALEHKADGVVAVGVPIAVGVLFGGDPVDDKVTAVVPIQAADDVQQGGLAGAAGAQNGHEFVVPQVQTDVVQCVLHQLAGLIFFVDLFELEHKCAFPVLRRRALLPVV